MQRLMIEQGLMMREMSDFGGTFNYGTPPVDYPCSLGSMGNNSRLVSGGFTPDSEIIITLRKSVLPANVAFNSGQPVTLTDRLGQMSPLQIANEGIRDLVYAWELTCSDINQGA